VSSRTIQKAKGIFSILQGDEHIMNRDVLEALGKDGIIINISHGAYGRLTWIDTIELFFFYAFHLIYVFTNA
jgi:hypothetical protein